MPMRKALCSPSLSFISIRFGSCEVRRLTPALNSLTGAPLKNQPVAKLTAFCAVLLVLLAADSVEIKHSQTVYLDKDIYLMTKKWLTPEGGIVTHARDTVSLSA